VGAGGVIDVDECVATGVEERFEEEEASEERRREKKM
jgi:Zn ribbon nucleic-acid-binding protein